ADLDAGDVGDGAASGAPGLGWSHGRDYPSGDNRGRTNYHRGRSMEAQVEIKTHWDHVYQSRPSDAVSWYQPHAWRSLELIREVAPRCDASILDVGAGASTLVDDLLDAG